VVRRLQWLGHEVAIADPLADPDEVNREYGLVPTDLNGERYDLVVGAVPHRAYRELSDEQIEALIAPGGTLADLKDMWRERSFNPGIDRWSL
jgi:UDP-N-acetyl-D-galactosamine dehydrogenase